MDRAAKPGPRRSRTVPLQLLQQPSPAAPPPAAEPEAPIGLWDRLPPHRRKALVAFLSGMVQNRLGNSQRRASHEPHGSDADCGVPQIQSRHFEPMAVVYVRQSSLHQVQQNQESTQLQYGLANTAERLGWPRERILVIDDDLGISGAPSEGRSGFQRLLSEVALDHVGLILGVEMSRLARSCKDWYQLLELCALFGTLIGDLDGHYDPMSYNDRLLLGLKGTMSEAELHILQQRMHQGAMQKARRGELVNLVPVGYIRRPSGEVTLDPDEQVQAIVRTIFEQFERQGSVGAVLRYLIANRTQLPVRMHSGPDKGSLQWRRPNKSAFRNMLRHPMYAGAYAYGRSRKDKQARPKKRRQRWLPPDQWQVLLRDRYPAYITWEQYERNVAQIKENSAHCEVPWADSAWACALDRAGRLWSVRRSNDDSAKRQKRSAALFLFFGACQLR